MDELSQLALQAAEDEQARERLIRSQESAVLAIASSLTHVYVTKSDDAWSAALSAFSKAVDSYDASRGSFRSYYPLVVQRGVLDWLRQENRHAREFSVPNTVFEDRQQTMSPEEYAAKSAVDRASMNQPASMREEIAAAGQEFAPFGFSFFDLTACCPKQERTRIQCARAAGWLLKHRPDSIRAMKKTGQLPAQSITAESGVPRKILERHRKYIIAITILLDGDYPQLGGFLQQIRKEALL